MPGAGLVGAREETGRHACPGLRIYDIAGGLNQAGEQRRRGAAARRTGVRN